MIQSTLMIRQHKHLHILGICGTAMAGIARLAQESGWWVTGSDAGVYPPMSDVLAAMNIKVRPFSVDNLDPRPDLVLVGNALSRGNVEVEAILDRGIAYTSGAQFVGDHVLGARLSCVVAGTHGKTTTSSLLAWALESAGRQPGFLIGGIPENFGMGARLGQGRPFVIEGDEYDTAFFDKRSKFLHYHPRLLILNNLEYDHADIFPDLEAIKRQFHHLIRTVPGSGLIVVNADDRHLADVLRRGCWTKQVRFARWGSDADADWYWQSVCEDGTRFRLFHRGRQVIEVDWSMLGEHHVANACAVAAAAFALGLSYQEIADALSTFAGVRRRMSLVGEAAGVRIYDDFAHHPTAIRGIVAAARAALGDQGRLWVVVEPRSNTMRTRVHEERLPACFPGADRVIFVRPASRGLAAEAMLDVASVCRKIGAHAKVAEDTETIIEEIVDRATPGDYVLVLSNGGFDDLHRRLLKALQGKSE
ncbi:MAG: UDP-N-acetylmuramate:L-alanyl-gamma-D-glutamyl-meso-diaminopimelate ligase [Zetaproteobacteria bacterium]|nr:MAG: UDP-N-acetylmuramate:L-alanyl-gamma-D-glutamyl-meso-diaminopimelate ligase [Zetaproteobacteria bacterium]